MEGYNGVFIDCTVFVFSGVTDPVLNIYVQVSNDKQNWATLPVGSTAVALSPAAAGYSKLDQSTIGQQVSAAWIRLKYETFGDIRAVCNIGLDRAKLGF